MMRRLAVIVVTLLLVASGPAVLAGPGGGTGGGAAASTSAADAGASRAIEVTSPSTGNAGTSRVAEVTRQATNNAGELQQLAISNQIRENAGGEEVARTVATIRERLQIMQEDRNVTREDWQLLKEDLKQLREQYRSRNEAREEIKNTFKAALQLAREQNRIQEAEQLLRDMITMDPFDSFGYRELGHLFNNRGENTPKVWCGGNQLKPDIPPVIKQGRTLIPVRAVTEALGATVQWYPAEQTVLISKGETEIRLQVRNRIALVNGHRVELEQPPEISTARVMVPLRLIAEAFNAQVGYYPEGQIITVNP